MNDYSIALFLHIVGTLGMFVVLGFEWIAVRRLGHATTVGQVRDWLQASNGLRRIGMVSMLTLFASGVYMMVTVWGGVPWITVTLGTLVLLMLVAALTGRPMAAIRRTVTTETGPLSPALASALYDPRFRVGIQFRTTVTLGIVFLMTVKPDMAGSLVAIALAALIGVALSLPLAGNSHLQQEPSA